MCFFVCLFSFFFLLYVAGCVFLTLTQSLNKKVIGYQGTVTFDKFEKNGIRACLFIFDSFHLLSLC